MTSNTNKTVPSPPPNPPERLCKTLVWQLKCTVTQHGSIGQKTDVCGAKESWMCRALSRWEDGRDDGTHLSLDCLKMHSSYRLGVSELQNIPKR